MHEGDLEAEQAVPRLGVDQLGTLLGEICECGPHVRHLVGDVVHPRAALREEPPDGRVFGERSEQLDAARAEANGRRLDALLLHALTMLEPTAEQALVRRDRLVEIRDSDPDVMNASCFHAVDVTVVVHMTRRLLIALVALTALVAGCGGGTKSNGEAKKAPAQVVADVTQAATGAKAVHVSGSITEAGQPVSLDLTLVQGTGGKGTISEAGLSFEIIRVGDTAYVKGSDAFLQQFAGAAASQLLHGKWLKGSATSGQFAALAPLTDVAKLFKSALASHGKLENKGETKYQGQKVVAIEDTTQGGTLYLAATGTPYPVALVGGKQQGSISFDKWDETVTITAPQNAIDLSTLGKD